MSADQVCPALGQELRPADDMQQACAASVVAVMDDHQHESSPQLSAQDLPGHLMLSLLRVHASMVLPLCAVAAAVTAFCAYLIRRRARHGMQPVNDTNMDDKVRFFVV